MLWYGGGYGQAFEIDSTLIYYVREYGFFLVAGVIFSTPIMRYLEAKIERSKLSNIMAVAVPLCYGLIFLWAASFVILGAHNPFIYFNF